ncbi:hypothetical protein [Leptothoe spongobia]|uniref:Uncharacterized protein n=1 Tax=Leptothoe spongobia TAU-MAC 1115 TaxID=1967444 RepID=A0A947DIQ0_9CYAN|nr:hypothetical protein [Leptothoe spongobia]MBT9317687.1 hypothetical protein [Leptothoe spongobia TAU-MAC 1115]
MGLFAWFNPNEKDTTTFEISNDAGEQVVFTIPTKGSNKIRKTLRDAGLERDTDDLFSRTTKYEEGQKRESQALRWWSQRDIDETEDIEWQGDHEGDTVSDMEDDREGVDPCIDDEESEQTALRFWPKW